MKKSYYTIAQLLLKRHRANLYKFMKSTLLFAAGVSASKLNPQALHNILAQTKFYHDEDGNSFNLNLASDILDIAKLIGANPDFWASSKEEGHENAWNFLNTIDSKLFKISGDVSTMDENVIDQIGSLETELMTDFEGAVQSITGGKADLSSV